MKSIQWIFALAVVLIAIGAGRTVAQALSEPAAKLSAANIFTNDLEASARFYTDILGFTRGKVRTLESPETRAVYGASVGADALYLTLLPAEFDRENPVLATLNLIQIGDAVAAKKDSAKSASSQGVLLAFRVSGIREIEQRVQASDVPIVTPLAASETGKSMTMTILDPSGVRLYLYAYER